LTSFWFFLGSFSSTKLLRLSLVETNDDDRQLKEKQNDYFTKKVWHPGLDAHYCCCY
jgi:hypothetical protein